MKHSPFRQKGNGFIGSFEYIDAHVPGGRQAVIAAVADEELRAYLSQRFLAGSWYDVLGTVAMLRAAAKVAAKPFDQYLRECMRWIADRDIRGVYKVFLALASPDMIIQRLPKIAAAHFDFVRAEVTQLGPGHYESRSVGLPSEMAEIYKAVSEAYMVRALEVSGAKNLLHRWLATEPGGEREGYQLVNLRRELRWSK